MDSNRKAAPGRQYASENHGCYINGPWPVHCLRHHEGDPLCVAIARYTSLDKGLGGSLKAIDYDIYAANNLKIPAGIDYLGIDIKDVKNSCYFSDCSANKYVQTGLS